VQVISCQGSLDIPSGSCEGFVRSSNHHQRKNMIAAMAKTGIDSIKPGNNTPTTSFRVCGLDLRKTATRAAITPVVNTQNKVVPVIVLNPSSFVSICIYLQL